MSKYIIDRVTKSDKYIISAGGNGTKFGWRDLSDLGKTVKNYHIGNDYNTPVGVKLYAPTDGEFLLTRRDPKRDYGNDLFFYMEEYDHTLHLAHLSDIAPLEGKKIKQGDYIGSTGNTGLSTGPHVHLGIAPGKKSNTSKGEYGDGTWINPSEFFLEKKELGVGDVVNFTQLATKSTAEAKIVNSAVTTGTITKVFKNRTYPFLIGKDTGFLNEAMISGQKVSVTKPKVEAPKGNPNIGQYANLIGFTWLFVEARTDETYPRPSRNNLTSLKRRSSLILKEDNGRYQVAIPGFDPELLWVAKSQVSTSKNAKFEIR